VQTFAEPLPADQGACARAPTSSDETLNISLLTPDALRLERWYGARLGHKRRWALIVEPHRKIAEMIDYILDFELGIQSVSVPRPRLIPTLFRRWVPDLVLAEIPFAEGAPSLRDLEHLRSVVEVSHVQRTPIPVLLCTTYVEITPALAQEAGFSGLIHKPFLPATLVSAVRGVLGGHLEGGLRPQLAAASGYAGG
jgi:DNA-binding NarL/FixJ family response regulator